MTKEQIFTAAKGLDLDDRMDLVDDLMSTIDPDEQRKIDDAWTEEIERRIDEIDRGDVKSIPADEVFEQLRAQVLQVNPQFAEIEFHPAAQAEFDEAIEYYRARRFELGRKFYDAVQVAIQEIIENPRRFPLISRRARRAKVRRFSYGLVYVIKDGIISMKAVMHLHRKPGYWTNRLR